MRNVGKYKIVVRLVYYDTDKKPYYLFNKRKVYVKNKNLIYGPSHKPLIQVLTDGKKLSYLL